MEPFTTVAVLMILREFEFNQNKTSLVNHHRFGGRTIAIFVYVYIWNNFRLIENPWNSPWTWIFCLFFQDFMYYLGHRAVHGMS